MDETEEMEMDDGGDDGERLVIKKDGEVIKKVKDPKLPLVQRRTFLQQGALAGAAALVGSPRTAVAPRIYRGAADSACLGGLGPVPPAPSLPPPIERAGDQRPRQRRGAPGEGRRQTRPRRAPRRLPART